MTWDVFYFLEKQVSQHRLNLKLGFDRFVLGGKPAHHWYPGPTGEVTQSTAVEFQVDQSGATCVPGLPAGQTVTGPDRFVTSTGPTTALGSKPARVSFVTWDAFLACILGFIFLQTGL